MKNLLLAWVFVSANPSLAVGDCSCGELGWSVVVESLISECDSSNRSVRPGPVVRFGILAGPNLSNMNFNRGFPKPSEPVPTTWQPGAIVGLSLDLEWASKWSVQQQYRLVRMRSRLLNANQQYAMTYFSFPVLVGYRVIPRLRVLAGPQFDLLLTAKASTAGVATTVTHETEERHFGALAGVAADLTRSFHLHVQYLHGLSHVGLGQRSSVLEFKYESIQCLIGLTF